TPHTTSVVSAVRASRPSVSCTPRDWTSAVWVVIIKGLIADGAAEEGPDHASGPSSLAGHPWLVGFQFFFLLRVFLNRMWISPTRRGSSSRMTSCPRLRGRLENPSPQPPPRGGEGERDRNCSPLRFGEGAGGGVVRQPLTIGREDVALALSMPVCSLS